MVYILREYQKKAVRAGISFFRETKSIPSLMVLPTAAGKSICIAEIVRHTPDKILIIQPTKELLQQNFEKYTLAGGNASIYSASFGIKQIGNVTFATIGSIKGVADIFKHRKFTKMIIDEVHLYPKGQAESMLGKFLIDSGITHVLGLTATPLKLHSFGTLEDNYSKLVMLTSKTKGEGFFKKIIHVTQVQEMVDGGYWSKLIYENHQIDQSRLIFNSTKSDYTEFSMKQTYKKNRVGEKILDRIKAMPERKSILVAVPSVAEAIELSSRCPNSVAVYGDMPKDERDAAITSFKKLRIRVVFQVNVLSVGFDHPQLDALICGRNTASFAWFYQFIGRATRIHSSKKDCLFVDFSGNTERFGKLEYIRFVQEGFTWKLYGENDILLTGVRIDEIGKHTQATEAIKKENSGNLKVIVKPKEGAPIKIFWGKFNGTEIKNCPTWYLEGMLNGKGPERKKANEFIFEEIERVLGKKSLQTVLTINNF